MPGFLRQLLPMAALMVLASPFSASAAPTSLSDKQDAFVADTLNQQVIPGFERFAEQSAQLEKALLADCKTPGTWTAAQAAFPAALQSWQSVQQWRTGPMELYMRHYAVQFWPDKKQHVTRHLNTLLAKVNDELVAPENYARQAVSVRGFPALEVLMYDPKFQGPKVDPAKSCQLATAIGGYLANTAKSAHQEWQSQADELLSVNATDEVLSESALGFMQASLEQLEIMRELKIERVRIPEGDRARPHRLESWRSAESLNNLQSNFDTLYGVYQGTAKDAGIASFIDSSKHDAIEAEWQAIQKTLSQLKGPLVETLEAAETQDALTDLSKSLSRLSTSLQAALAEQGIYLGFNSRDGD